MGPLFAVLSSYRLISVSKRTCRRSANFGGPPADRGRLRLNSALPKLRWLVCATPVPLRRLAISMSVYDCFRRLLFRLAYELRSRWKVGVPRR